MATKSQRPNGQDGALSSLSTAIDALNLAKSSASITPAKAAFDSTSVLLTTIVVGSFLPTLVDCWLMYTGSMINEVDYVEPGLACAGVCEALDRGINGRRVNQLSQSVLTAIEKLTAS